MYSNIPPCKPITDRSTAAASIQFTCYRCGVQLNAAEAVSETLWAERSRTSHQVPWHQVPGTSQPSFIPPDKTDHRSRHSSSKQSTYVYVGFCLKRTNEFFKCCAVWRMVQLNAAARTDCCGRQRFKCVEQSGMLPGTRYTI